MISTGESAFLVPGNDLVIPAVRGEFYSYSATFTIDRPFGFLMKCKANKSQPLNTAEEYPEEVDMVFTFRQKTAVHSPDSEACLHLFEGRVKLSDLNKTRIGFPNIDEKAFCRIREKKNVAELVRVCNTTLEQHSDQSTLLTAGTILAVNTSTGKFGLLLIREIADDSVVIDACHILL